MLRRRELGEADLLLTLFSPTHGRITASARSARKPTAKLMGKLEPSMELDLMLARGKTLDVVTEAKLIAARSALREDLLKVAYGSYLLELFDQVAEAVDDAAPLYVILSHALALLEADAGPEMTLRWCEIRLVGALGWEPQMDACVACEGSGDVTWRFSTPLGGLLCPACSRHDSDSLGVSAGTVALYRQLQHCQVTLVPRLSAETVVAYQLESVMRRHLAYRMPHRLKSLAFLEQVRRMEGQS